ncbi:MAG: alpha/beta hydrolase [Gammaproteobacteria bacterium]|nr:alpha/beta hydrolase [Gammaproteobacteria bacterium]
MRHHAAITKEALSLSGPAGVLEALLETPEGRDFDRVALIAHPHPLHHGSMLNKVVHTVARAMLELGVPALRFNFRGVGASDGQFAEGVGETDDVLAAAGWLRTRYPGAGLLMAGFSFGAMVTCNAAVTAVPDHLVSIAPPASRARKLLAGRRPDCPWIIIQGDADGVVSASEVAEWAAGFDPPPELVILPGVDHFFHGNLTQLRQTIVRRLGAT